jgi:diaminopimelate decarboxylase
MHAREHSRRKLGKVDMVALAEHYGTPLYVLFEERLEENFRRYQTALERVYSSYLICYAVKANTTFAILKLLGELGAGADVASEYELHFALDAGIPPEKIRANGNCKSEQYLEDCITKGITINVDPEEELAVINALARELGTEARINLRLAGFPLTNITSPAITTSTNWSKFGIPIQRAPEAFTRALTLEHLIPNGLMVHLGSQITDITAYHVVCDELIRLAQEADEIGFEVNELDLGGGCGISYLGEAEWRELKQEIRHTKDTNTTWGNEQLGFNCTGTWVSEELYCPFTPDTFVHQLFTERHPGTSFKEKLAEIGNPQVVLEPGRSMVGNAQVTLVRVCHVGTTPGGENIVHVNAGVNHHSQNIVVPEQLHRMEVANRIRIDAGERFETFIAGNLCYTGDLLCRIKTVLNVKPERGDYLLIYDTGAYADFFSSTTNSFPRPAKVLVTKTGEHRVVVARERFEEVFQRDVEWRVAQPQGMKEHEPEA